MSDRLISPIPTSEETSEQANTQNAPDKIRHKAKQRPHKAKQKTIKATQKVVQTNLAEDDPDTPPAPDDIRSKPAKRPDTSKFPNYATASPRASERQRRVYIHTLVSRLFYYRTQFIHHKESEGFQTSVEADKEITIAKIRAKRQGLDENEVSTPLIAMLQTLIFRITQSISHTLQILDKHPNLRESLPADENNATAKSDIDMVVDRLIREAEKVQTGKERSNKEKIGNAKLPKISPLLNEFITEMTFLQKSKGSIQHDDKARLPIDPKQHQNAAFENTYARSNSPWKKRSERIPGSETHLRGQLFELHMSVESTVTYLYQILIEKPGQSQEQFIQAVRLLSRPNVREVENAFVYHMANQSRITLREAIIKVFGMPIAYKKALLKSWDIKREHNGRTKYLFELLDNKGQASTATRIALSLGAMNKDQWGKLVADEKEVVRLIEKLKPKELSDFWVTYKDKLKQRLNNYHYQRVENYVAANRRYASVDTAAEILEEENKKEEADRSKITLEQQNDLLGDWQQHHLGRSNAFLNSKDLQLEGIIRSYISGANKFTGKKGFRAFIKGNAQDLKKEVARWVKEIIKEEKKYFGGYPLIRKYVMGEAIRFRTARGHMIEIPAQEGKTHTAVVLGGISKELKKKLGEISGRRKMGWNVGDRTLLKVLLTAGFDQEGDTTKGPEASEEEGLTSREQLTSLGIDAEKFQDSIGALEKTIESIRSKGMEVAPEVLVALAEIIGQAKITGNWTVINRRQDLFKAIMELSDHMRVQFLSCFSSSPIEHARNTHEANQLVEEALHEIERVLTGLNMLPKQIYEVLGKLKYGSDISDNYLQLRRLAGLTNYTRLRGVGKYVANEAFLPRRALEFALLLAPQELTMAKQDKAMHQGLEFKFVEAIQRNPTQKYFDRVGRLFEALFNHLGVTPEIVWDNINQGNKKEEYQNLKERERPAEQDNGREDRAPGEAQHLNYYIKYIGQEAGAGEAAELAKQERKVQEDHQNKLVTETEMNITQKAYQQKIDSWRDQLATLLNKPNTNYYQKMRMMMRIWQEGDKYYVPRHYEDVHVSQDHPYFGKKNSKKHRKDIFLYEVFHALPDATQKKFTKGYWDITGHYTAALNKSISNLRAGSSDIIEEIIYNGFRWFRKLDGKDKKLTESTFIGLKGRVLLDTWTDYQTPDPAQEALRQEIRQQEQRIKTLQQNGEANIEQEIEKLEKTQAKYQQLAINAMPLPKPAMLKKLEKGGNQATYTSLVTGLLERLKEAAEEDTAFIQTLLEAGYTPDALLTLPEKYLYLIAQVEHKKLNEGVNWKFLTAKGFEYQEGTARLMSDMRNIAEVQHGKKPIEEVDKAKDQFEKTYKEDVVKRNENFEKSAATYRKNIKKIIELTALLSVVPIASAGVGAVAILDEFIFPLAYAATGMVTKAIDKVLDPNKESIRNYVGDMGFEFIKSGLVALVFGGSFILSAEIKDGKFLADFPLAKEALRQVSVGQVRGVAIALINTLEDTIKKGPGEEVWQDLKNSIFTLDFLAKTLTKSATNTTFQVTGLNDLLKGTLGSKGPDVEIEELDDKERNAEFRANEATRAIRRYINTPLGLDELVAITKFMVSNRNPLFKSFEDKSDTEDVASPVRRLLENRKKDLIRQEAEEALDELQWAIGGLEEEMQNDPDYASNPASLDDAAMITFPEEGSVTEAEHFVIKVKAQTKVLNSLLELYQSQRKGMLDTSDKADRKPNKKSGKKPGAGNKPTNTPKKNPGAGGKAPGTGNKKGSTKEPGSSKSKPASQTALFNTVLAKLNPQTETPVTLEELEEAIPILLAATSLSNSREGLLQSLANLLQTDIHYLGRKVEFQGELMVKANVHNNVKVLAVRGKIAAGLKIDIQMSDIVGQPNQEAQLTVDERLAQDGLQVQIIPGDGDCFYNAVRHQIRLQGGNPPSVRILRNAVVSMLQHNRRVYETSFQGTVSIDAAIGNIKRMGSYANEGGDLAPQILPTILGINIKVIDHIAGYQMLSSNPHTPVPPALQHLQLPNTFTPLTIIYANRNHYNSTCPAGD